MGRTKRTQVALYLDEDKVEALRRLAKRMGRTQQDLLRSSVAALLTRFDDGDGKYQVKRKDSRRTK